jgi:hypothetical protein
LLSTRRHHFRYSFVMPALANYLIYFYLLSTRRHHFRYSFVMPALANYLIYFYLLSTRRHHFRYSFVMPALAHRLILIYFYSICYRLDATTISKFVPWAENFTSCLLTNRLEDLNSTHVTFKSLPVSLPID